LSQDLNEDQLNILKDVLRKFSKGSLFTQKDNLPHHESTLWGDDEHRADYEMDIEVDQTQEPSTVKSRQMSPKEKAEMKRQLMWMLTHGFVNPSTSRYSSPVLFVKKGDGALRFCVDYRAINLITKTEKFPVPRIDELIDKLSKSRYYSAIDACQGYHQFGLTKNAQQFTAFECPFGRFEYCRIPFGLKNAVSHYQRVMSSLVGENTVHASYVCNLLDDVLIFSETFDDHVKHVATILEVMEKAKIFLNLSKCTFGFEELKWMGHIIGRGTRKPSPEKTKDVQNYPVPTTVTEVRSLLGVITYLGEYIPNLQKLLAPFKEIRNGAKNAKVQLNDEQLQGWEQVKQILSSGTVLRLPDFGRKFFLQTDASEFAVGCCLLQPYDGKLFPVEYYSRVLNGAQRNYAIYDKELLAMQEGMKKFRAYLQHDEFVLLTDHKPLTHLRTQATINLRQMRFLEFDAEFDYKIVYIKGEDNIFADFLSRPPGEGIDKSKLSPSQVSNCSLCRQTEMENMYQDFEKRPTEYLSPPTELLYTHTCGNTEKPVTIEDIDKWTKVAGGKADDYVASLFAEHVMLPKHRQSPAHGDTVHSCVSYPTWEHTLASLSKIAGIEGFSKKRITEGYVDDSLAKEILSELQSPHNDHHYNRKYQLLNGLIYLVHGRTQHGLTPTRGRVYIPNDGELRVEIIKLFHNNVTCGHRDADGTYMHVAEDYYFPNMHRVVQQVVKNCEDCQRTKYITKSMSGLHQPLEAPPPQPWQNIATDFVCGLVESIDTISGATYNKIQIYVDRLSREVVLVPGHNTDTAETTARRYRDRVFPFKGIPESIVSDRDPLFTSEFWDSLSQIFNTRLKMSSAHHPQTDGLSERMVGVLTTMISIFVNYRQNDWADYLGLLQFALNRHTVKNRANLTPFLISQGYNPFGPTDFTIPTKVLQQGNDRTIDFHQRQKAAAQAAHDAIVAGQDVVARRANKSRTRVTYQPGDRLYLKKDHVFPPGEKDKPSHKLRQRWMGPYTVTRRVGELAVELDIKGDKLLNHPVFHVESTKPCPKDTVLKTAECGAPDSDE
jgi:transposase InsO family protein